MERTQCYLECPWSHSRMYLQSYTPKYTGGGAFLAEMATEIQVDGLDGPLPGAIIFLDHARLALCLKICLSLSG